MVKGTGEKLRLDLIYLNYKDFSQACILHSVSIKLDG